MCVTVDGHPSPRTLPPFESHSSLPQVPVPESTGEISFGQPVWARDGSGLVLVGWPSIASNFPAIVRSVDELSFDTYHE